MGRVFSLSSAASYVRQITVAAPAPDFIPYPSSTTALALSGAASYASASLLLQNVWADSQYGNTVFDITATNAGASIASLAGAGIVTLGSQTLTITNASGNFAGTIGGSGGITVAG